MSQKFPSAKRKVKCRFCDEEMLEKNYSVHLHRKHKQGYSGDKRSAGQMSLANFVVHPVKNAEKEVKIIEKEINTIEKEVTNTRKENVSVTLSCASEDSPKDDSTMDEENFIRYPSEMENAAAANTTDDKFNLILEHIKRLEKEVASLRQKETNPSPSNIFPKDCKNEREADDEENTVSYVFKSCRSISDITSFFDEFEFKFDEILSTVVCRTCVPVGNSLPEKTGLNNHPAIFLYNTENGLDFPVGCNLPNAFRCL